MLGIVKSDARKIPLADESVQCVVTSPPYWGLRKYAGEQELTWGGREGCEHEWSGSFLPSTKNAQQGSTETVKYNLLVAQGKPGGSLVCIRCGAWRGAYGLEPTVEMYVQHTVEILREIRRVLRDDGVVFWNIGDSYCSIGHKKSHSGFGTTTLAGGKSQEHHVYGRENDGRADGLKHKDLCLIPFRVALAAQADGWWVRSDIIWAKPNPMPESVTDRPTRSHEYILMLTKSQGYYWDAEAVKEPSSQPLRERNDFVGGSSWKEREQHGEGGNFSGATHRNLRSVWIFTTEPYPEAHFATFPEELPKRCILAATRTGDLVLDPFAGSGTVGKVAIELGRRAILCDLAYQDLASKRTAAIQRPLIAPAEAGWRE